jgi:hypothetical protein
LSRWVRPGLSAVARRAKEGGTFDSSPVRSAGKWYRRHVRPGRDDRNARGPASHPISGARTSHRSSTPGCIVPGRERGRWRLRFLVVGSSSFGGLFRSGKSSGPDRTVAATAPGSPCGREHTRWRLRFLVVGSSSFGGFFRSGKSSGPARTVAATAPGSPCGREHARWRLRFLVVGREQLRRAF